MILRISYLKKIFNDQKVVVLLLMLFGFLFEYLYAWLFFESEISGLVETYIKFLPRAVITLMGVDTGSQFFSTQMLAFGYAHPIILISLSFLPVSLPARYLSGEIETRTFDLLLSRPLHRSAIPGGILFFLTVALALQTIFVFLGTLAGWTSFDLEIDIKRYGLAMICAYFFYLSMGCGALLIAAFQNEKGRALARIIGVVVFLYFVDTILKLSTSLEPFLAYSYFQLYQPGSIVLGTFDWLQGVLISIFISAVLFSFALLKFLHRDL